MLLNINKTKLVLFSGNFKPSYIPRIFIENTELKYSNSVNFLGVIFSNKLKWDDQINSVCTKIAKKKKIGIICKIAYFLPKIIIKRLYFSFVYSHLIYRVSVWGKTTNKNIGRLIALQKKYLRLIYSGNQSSDEFFLNNNLLNFKQIYEFRIYTILFHRIKNNNYLDIIKLKLQTHSKNTRSANNYTTIAARTNHLMNNINSVQDVE